MKKILTFALLTFTISLQTQDFKIAKPPEYYITCWEVISSPNFMKAAMKPLEDAEDQYDDLVESTMQEIIDGNQLIYETIESSYSDLLSGYAMIKEQEFESMVDIQTEISNMEAEFEARRSEMENYLATAKFPVNLYSSSATPNIEKDTPEWNYYKAICDQDKIISNTLNPNNLNKSNSMISLDTNNALNEQISATNIRSIYGDRQRFINEHYCSENDVQTGICEEASDTPYAHLSAQVFLNPIGNGALNDQSDFKARYTYTDVEEAIATDYLSTVVLPLYIDTPRLSEYNRSNSLHFIALYSHYISALNLANYSFAVAKQNRVPQFSIPMENGELMPISYIDNLRYLIFKAGSDKKIAAISNAGGTTLVEEAYKINILNTKLQLELYLQQRRINILDAAILAVMENSPEQFENFNSIK